ncbi:MAG: hypothetical protein ACRDGM_03650 [bacterium]
MQIRNHTPRTIILPVRLSRDEYAVLAQLARAEDRPRCSMIRRLIVEAALRGTSAKPEVAHADR